VENAVQAAYTTLQTSQVELETNRKRVELSEQNYEVINNRYRNGLALVTDMVDAANQRLDAQLSLVNSRINVLYNYYQLKFVTGTL
jgi:outer membrane protein TolC